MGKGQFRLPDAAAEEDRAGGSTTDFPGQHVHQLILCVRLALGEPVLEMVPDAFVGIQFGGTGRKGPQMKAARKKEEFLDRIAAVDLVSAQQNDQLTRDPMHEMAQEHGGLLALRLRR